MTLQYRTEESDGGDREQKSVRKANKTNKRQDDREKSLSAVSLFISIKGKAAHNGINP